MAAIEAKKDVICHVADTIWANPELSLQEVKSAALYCRVLEQEGFQVEKRRVRYFHCLYRQLW